MLGDIRVTTERLRGEYEIIFMFYEWISYLLNENSCVIMLLWIFAFGVHISLN